MTVDLGLDPFAPEVRADPYPVYRRMREEAPVYRAPNGDILLTRYDDIVEIVRDHARWSSDSSNAAARDELVPEERVLAVIDARPMLFSDPPDHTRLRGLVNKAFTPKRVEGLRPRLEAIVEDLLDDAVARAADRGDGTIDVIADVAWPLPVVMIAELLGVPVADRERLKEWSEPLARTIDPFERLTPEVAEAAGAAGMAFIVYFAQLIAERRQRPADDLLSALIAAEEAGDQLTQEELIVNLILLLIAGHETTTNLIGNGMLALLRHPGETARLRADPELIKPAVEELLRYDSPVQLTARTALADMPVGDDVIHKGEMAILLLAAANRDPAQFPDPDRLDLGRADNRHVAFSSGIHFCVGAPLARVEGQVAINALLRRFPDLALAADTVGYKDNVTLRGLASLPVAI